MALQECGLNLNQKLKETDMHGTAAFPCSVHQTEYTDEEGGILPWHWHPAMELICIRGGRLKVQIPGKSFSLNQNEIIFINSNILHFAMGEPKAEIHSFVFNHQLITGQENSVFARKYIKPLTSCTSLDALVITDYEEIREKASAAFQTAFEEVVQEKEGYEFTAREKLSGICFEIWSVFRQEIDDRNMKNTLDGLRVGEMCDFIHKHYAEDIMLSQIAKAADIGERECLRCFNRVMQTSPMQYLIKYRVTRGASILLEEEEKSIAEAAMLCGFESPSNFSQMFKRYFKCSPREYRKRL